MEREEQEKDTNEKMIGKAYKKELLENRKKREEIFLPFFLRRKNLPFLVFFLLVGMILLFIALWKLSGMNSVLAASDSEIQDVDLVILIDTSGSIQSDDLDEMEKEIAKFMVEQLEFSSRVAIVPFSDEIGEIIPLMKLCSNQDREEIKNQIALLTYSRDTDIGLALKQGYQILKEEEDSKNQKVLFLLTDGEIDLPGNTDREEDSFLDSLKVADWASQEKIPIYTIGFREEEAADSELLSMLTIQTGGKNYLIDEEKIPEEIFQRIAMDFDSFRALNTEKTEETDVDSGQRVSSNISVSSNLSEYDEITTIQFDEKGTENDNLSSNSIGNRNQLFSESLWKKWIALWFILAFGWILFFCFFIKRRKEKERAFYGVLQWAAEKEEWKLHNCPLYSEKGYLSLEEVMKEQEYLKRDLSKVKIHMNQTFDGIVILNHSKRWKMTEKKENRSVHKICISHNEAVRLTDSYAKESVSIQITYQIR